MPDRMVLDSFALISYFLGQTAGPLVAEILEKADRGEVNLAIASVNLGEVLYRVERESNRLKAAEALQVVRTSSVEVVSVDESLAIAASRVKTDLRMGYLDCFVVSLAERLEAKILTGDPDFRRVENLVEIAWLER